MVGQAREGTSDKTGVGRTKDDGAVTVQHKSPGTPCGAGHVGLTHTETQRGSCGQPGGGGVWTAKTVKRPPQQPAQPQCANYWALLTRKRHILPHSA